METIVIVSYRFIQKNGYVLFFYKKIRRIFNHILLETIKKTRATLFIENNISKF